MFFSVTHNNHNGNENKLPISDQNHEVYLQLTNNSTYVYIYGTIPHKDTIIQMHAVLEN